jgi:Ca-activated chloride channel family protein
MFRLENPILLNLLWGLALLAILLASYWRWRQRTLRQLGSPALAERLMLGFSSSKFWFKNVLFGLSLALIAVAIANPQRAERRTPPAQQSSDVLIALDISQSMLAKDVAPSRLEAAKTFIQKLAEQLEKERLGLIFFAGDAYAQMPLSTDVGSLMLFVRNANTDYITTQGTDVISAIELAGRLFNSESQAGRALIIVSDGEHHEADALIRARKARAEGIVIHTVAVGTAAGANIPVGKSGAKRDFTGQTIRTQANEILLRDIAKAGGGVTLNLSDAGAVKSLAQEIASLQKTAVEAKAYTEYVSYFQWLILPALLLLALEQLLWWRRRGS